jgi:DNA-binding response OmpR family regulator
MTVSPTILLVDRNTRNLDLLAGFLQKQGYTTVSLSDLGGFEQVLDGNNLEVALVDVSGFDRSIWENCQMLTDRNVPFVVISPKQVASIREEGRSHGARDVLLKPLIAQDLSSLIRRLVGR